MVKARLRFIETAQEPSSLSAGERAYLGPPGSGSSGQGGAGACWVHGAVFWYIQGSVQIINVHQRIKVLGLRGGQDMGLYTVDFTQLEIRGDFRVYWLYSLLK